LLPVATGKLPMSILTPRRPVLEARIAGALYVLIIMLGAYAELVGREGLVVGGHPLATLHTIAIHQHAYRLGFVAEMVTNLLAIPTTLIFWRLLTPSGPVMALTALVFDLTQNTINALNAWTQFVPLTLVGNGRDVAALAPSQLADFARLFLHWHDVGFQIGLTFFAFALLLEGWLVFRARYFPGWLGLLYIFAGACYLGDAINFFLALHLPLVPYLLWGSFVGEAAMALWLLTMGVDAHHWQTATNR
jgi:hypothetical protein